jgi:hypothetical protein
MKNIRDIKTEQLLHLQEKCFENGVEFNSMKKLIEAEKVKKLQRRNHFIQQTIDFEIDNKLK